MPRFKAASRAVVAARVARRSALRVPSRAAATVFGRTGFVHRHAFVRATSLRDLAEEAAFAYKDVHAVTAAAEAAGISRRVAHLSPVGNVKG